MSNEIEGVIEVKNVWCGCCGKQEFIMHHSFILTCTHCESEMKFSYMSHGIPGEWYVYDAPATPHAPDSIDKDKATRTGIEWIPYENSEIYHARKKYNCNTGKKLGDELVVRKLKKLRDGLLCELEKIKYNIRREEEMGKR